MIVMAIKHKVRDFASWKSVYDSFPPTAAGALFARVNRESPETTILVDEAYFEFSRQTMRQHMTRCKNLVILRTFSKAFSLAGLRVGYLLAHEDVVTEFMKVRQPYSVDSFSQWVAGSVYRERMVFEQAIRDIIRGRDQVMHGLSMLAGVEVFPSEANYVLFRVEHAGALASMN